MLLTVRSVLYFLTVNAFSFAKIYERCELAKELKYIHEFPTRELSTWICIAQHESLLNTSAINPGSGDHGLFQISQEYWCSPPGSGCNTACVNFRDDNISDDVKCVRKIFKEHQRLFGNGFHAWAVYPLYCNKNTSKYIQGCFETEINNIVNGIEEAHPIPFKEEKDEYDDGYDFPPLPSKPKIYRRCELIHELRHVHKIQEDHLSKWICIVEHESNYNTSANNLRSGDHGLFQISELYWCSRDSVGYGCNANCASFRDSNIVDDVKCIRKIYDEHTAAFGDGFNAWVVYPRYCKGDTTKYMEGCTESQKNIEHDTEEYQFPALPTTPKSYLDIATDKGKDTLPHSVSHYSGNQNMFNISLKYITTAQLNPILNVINSNSLSTFPGEDALTNNHISQPSIKQFQKQTTVKFGNTEMVKKGTFSVTTPFPANTLNNVLPYQKIVNRENKVLMGTSSSFVDNQQEIMMNHSFYNKQKYQTSTESTFNVTEQSYLITSLDNQGSTKHNENTAMSQRQSIGSNRSFITPTSKSLSEFKINKYLVTTQKYITETSSNVHNSSTIKNTSNLFHPRHAAPPPPPPPFGGRPFPPRPSRPTRAPIPRPNPPPLPPQGLPKPIVTFTPLFTEIPPSTSAYATTFRYKKRKGKDEINSRSSSNNTTSFNSTFPSIRFSQNSHLNLRSTSNPREDLGRSNVSIQRTASQNNVLVTEKTTEQFPGYKYVRTRFGFRLFQHKK